MLHFNARPLYYIESVPMAVVIAKLIIIILVCQSDGLRFRSHSCVTNMIGIHDCYW
jgi:hypothetical protein